MQSEAVSGSPFWLLSVTCAARPTVGGSPRVRGGAALFAITVLPPRTLTWPAITHLFFLTGTHTRHTPHTHACAGSRRQGWEVRRAGETEPPRSPVLIIIAPTTSSLRVVLLAVRACWVYYVTYALYSQKQKQCQSSLSSLVPLLLLLLSSHEATC
jgi:hypothetical protein